jgi:pimeloyl-ACP methyl ester carboxylesterase
MIPPTPEAAELLIRQPGPTREERIELGLISRELLAGKDNPFDHAEERRRIERAYDRMYYPDGFGRQLVAILAAESRTTRLGGVEMPALVVHGQDDPLIPVENGRIVAAAIPGARLLELEGMGHNLPVRYWPVVADAIAETARAATPRLSA